MRVPPGFVLHVAGNGRRVVAPPDLLPTLLEAGIDRPEKLLRERPAGPGTGRGPRAVVELPGGERVLVKQYLRGGALARVNRERYAGAGRFFRELAVGARLRELGLPVGEVRAVVLEGRPPLLRVFGVARFVPEAPDLARWFTELVADRDEASRLWRAALALVDRFHDAGLLHPDLNLGNLLARREGRRFDLWLVDLDRARLLPGGLGEGLRAAGKERLARSYRKIVGEEPPAPG